MPSTDLQDKGFVVIRAAISVDVVDRLKVCLGEVEGAGRRGMLRLSEIASFAASDALTAWVSPLLPATSRPVRAIYFDKKTEANWLVTWHQDLSIAVTQRREASGFGPWSVKDGIDHVQAPVSLLEQMLTVRVHLDDADESNGALKVLPGTHRLGILGTGEIARLRSEVPEHLCESKAGDVLLMRPLLLHASGRSKSPTRRRVLHIEYAGCDLPENLEWSQAA